MTQLLGIFFLATVFAAALVFEGWRKDARAAREVAFGVMGGLVMFVGCVAFCVASGWLLGWVLGF